MGSQHEVTLIYTHSTFHIPFDTSLPIEMCVASFPGGEMPMVLLVGGEGLTHNHELG